MMGPLECKEGNETPALPMVGHFLPKSFQLPDSRAHVKMEFGGRKCET